MQYHRPLFPRVFRAIGTATVLLGLATCVEESSGPRSPGPRADVSDAASAAVLVGAGDIGDCTKPWDSVTANLVDGISGTVFAAGDNAYPNGTSSEYANCYKPTWGRFKARTRPVPGNHDYNTSGAAGYFGYFGAAAGEPGKGYYSFNLGAWHIIALNSNISMEAGSAQEQWLRADLGAHPALCTLAFWHHPLFSSSTVAVDAAAEAAWQDLYDAGAELIINGHHHDYERFAPQTPAGVADAAHGIREIVVGTGGGEGLFPFGATAVNSEAKDNETFGVLKLTLRADGYDWQFIPIPGKTFRDSGSGTCHDRPGSPPAENQPPTAGFTSSCSGLTCNFTSTSSDPDGTIASWRWTFGDGASSTEQNPTHTYGAGGTYTVNLAVTDDRGATGTTSKSVTVGAANQAPSASFSASCSGLTCSFTDASSDPDGRVVAWRWSFGDGGSSSSQNPSHTYGAGGTYTVRLTVTDDKGATDATSKAVTVSAPNRAPSVKAGPDATVMIGLYTLRATFSDPDNDGPWSYRIDWGDGLSQSGSTSSQGDAITGTHPYLIPSSYRIRVTVVDSHGASGSDDLVLTVKLLP